MVLPIFNVSPDNVNITGLDLIDRNEVLDVINYNQYNNLFYLLLNNPKEKIIENIPMVNDCEVKSNSYYKVNRVDPSETIREFTYRTEFTYSGNRYELEIMFVKDSTRDKDLLGVHGIRLRNRDTNDSVTVNTINSDI